MDFSTTPSCVAERKKKHTERGFIIILSFFLRGSKSTNIGPRSDPTIQAEEGDIRPDHHTNLWAKIRPSLSLRYEPRKRQHKQGRQKKKERKKERKRQSKRWGAEAEEMLTKATRRRERRMRSHPVGSSIRNSSPPSCPKISSTSLRFSSLTYSRFLECSVRIL